MVSGSDSSKELKNTINKLGQRQSQTPFSSVFWVQKDFRPKKILGPKILDPKTLSQIKILSSENFASKDFESKIF